MERLGREITPMPWCFLKAIGRKGMSPVVGLSLDVGDPTPRMGFRDLCRFTVAHSQQCTGTGEGTRGLPFLSDCPGLTGTRWDLSCVLRDMGGM